MRELRLSIPFVGGVTAIYTPEEVQQKKDVVVKSTRSAITSIKKYCSKTITMGVELLGDVQHRASTLTITEVKNILVKK